MFCATFDVASSFDTIFVDKLVQSVLPAALRCREYVIVRYVVVYREANGSKLLMCNCNVTFVPFCHLTVELTIFSSLPSLRDTRATPAVESSRV